MSILIDKSTRLLVQGITGRDGHFHAVKMKEYGTNVVGGTSPGKGGSTVDGLPVFNTMYEAVEKTQANASILFDPASYRRSQKVWDLSIILNEASRRAGAGGPFWIIG